MPTFVLFGDLLGGTRQAAEAAGAILSSDIKNRFLNVAFVPSYCMDFQQKI